MKRITTLACAAVLLALAAPVVRAEVRSVRVPGGGQVPDVKLDPAGVLHMTYGTGLPGDAFYVQSKDGGKTFSPPVKLNTKAATVTTGMERGPRLALGKDGVIHVLWQGWYKTGGGTAYSRSTDGGKTFAPERRLESPAYGLDNVALAADDQGNVVALWTGGFPGAKEDPDSPTASPIVLTYSRDNGATFSKNELVKSDHPASSNACACCRLEARIAGGKLYVAFRGGYKNLRDPWLLVGPLGSNDFRCVRVSEDNWDHTCPMQGIPLTVGADGRVLVSWMSRNRGYWSTSDPAVKSFEPKHAVPMKGSAKLSFPHALPTKDGVFLLWQVGHDAQWALVGADGTSKTTGRVGVQGMGKVNAFVGADGHLYVVH